MACCIIAAYLAALAMAKLRQWAAFWGLVPPLPGYERDTLWMRVAMAFRRPASRRRTIATLTHH